MKNKNTSMFGSFNFWFVLMALVLFVLPAEIVHAQEEAQTFPYKKSFVISAYYSPLPGQPRYVRGSYEADIRLNGNGTNSANGAEVSPGLIAAPKNFVFGTKMEIPGIGTVEVRDRGGAIVDERLDIWMGHGADGMARALAWGKRRVEVTVFGIDNSIAVAVDLESLPKVENAGIVVGTNYFKEDLSQGSQGIQVRELQRLLKELGSDFYNGMITGVYEIATVQAVTKFQFNSGVVSSSDDVGVGVFGPRTRVTFETQLDERIARELERVPTNIIQPGVSGESVGQLQVLLQLYGEAPMDGFVAGAFDDVTRNALLNLQLQFGVVNSPEDVGAGYYGPQTQEVFQKLILQRFTPSFGGAISNALPVATVISATVAQGAPAHIVPVYVPPTFTRQIVLNDSGGDVSTLQEELKRLRFFGLDATGFYGKTTEHAVYKFQQYYGIVESKKTLGAGVVGPQTREKLNDIITLRKGHQNRLIAVTETRQVIENRVENERSLVATVSKNPTDVFNNDANFGERGAHVEKLQQVLQRLGFFPGKVTTEYFGASTKNALIVFQQSHGLTPEGSLDFPTRRKLNEILVNSKAG